MKRLTLRIPDNLHHKLKKESYETGSSINEILNILIKEKFNNEKMKQLEKVKKELLNKDFTLIDLDNKMVKLGYYTIEDYGLHDYLLECRNIVYTEFVDSSSSVNISFDVVTVAGNIFTPQAAFIKVTKVEEF